MSEVYKFHDGLFYPPDIKYESIPKDAVDVSEEDFIKAMSRPAGWNFSVDKKGVVTLTAPPPQTKEQLISTAEFDRVVLRQQADGEITWRQDAVDAEIATDEEAAALAAWKKYRILLMRTDTSTAPDVKWPKQPGS